MTILRNRRLNGLLFGLSLPSTGLAPGQISSLAAGTVTSTTIPVTYTAASGTAPITYAGYTSPHTAASWTLNAGTFGATGGTFTGLSAATSYDLQIVASNGSGSSTTNLTSGVTTSAAAIAPSQVGSLTAASPTAYTIPVTYTAPSGTAPFSFVGYTSPHGANNFAQNSGSFNNSGGVFVGLSPATGYDLRIVTTNSAGSSTTNLLTGISTTAAPSFTGAANRYDIVLGASATAPGSAVTGALYPNGKWNGETITLAAVSGSGAFSPTTIATTSGSSASVSFSYTPNIAGEHAVGATNSGSLYNPHTAPLNAFATGAGVAQTLAVQIAPATQGAAPLDPQPRQYDTLATLAKGFSFAGAKGYGSVALNVTAIGGATDGLWVRLYDANSSGATTTVASGTALHATPVQVYGPISAAAAAIHVMLPASQYYYYADIATDPGFTRAVRIPQRIVVGLGIGLLGRSQEAGISQWYYDNSTPTGETFANTLVRYGADSRYEPNYVGYYRQTGTAQSASHADGSDPNGPSSGAQAAGRIIAATLGVNVFMIGIDATGGGVDQFINHDGSLSAAAQYTFTDGGIDAKFRWLWAASLDGWDNVNSAYPESFAEYQLRFTAAMDWVARTYPSCAVQGWGAGGTGRPEPNGSAISGVNGVSTTPGAARLQSIFFNQVEPVNPMVVSKENYAWAAFCGSHGDSGSKRIYAQTGLRQLLSAELAINGGLQTQNRGPSLLTAGTGSTSTRIIRIYGKFNGGGGLQTVTISQLKPNYTVAFNQATASNLCDLVAVYGPGGYSGNGLAIKITGVAINYANLPSGADFSLDATLAGTTGITYSDGSTGAFPNSFAVQYAADLQASGGNGYVVWDTTSSPPPTSQVTMICDTQVSSPWEWGRHIRPQLDIAITVGS